MLDTYDDTSNQEDFSDPTMHRLCTDKFLDAGFGCLEGEESLLTIFDPTTGINHDIAGMDTEEHLPIVLSRPALGEQDPFGIAFRIHVSMRGGSDQASVINQRVVLLENDSEDDLYVVDSVGRPMAKLNDDSKLKIKNLVRTAKPVQVRYVEPQAMEDVA